MPSCVERVLSEESQEALEALLAEGGGAFLVDWREADEAIVGYCESAFEHYSSAYFATPNVSHFLGSPLSKP